MRRRGAIVLLLWEDGGGGYGLVVLGGMGGFRCVVPLRPAVRLASVPFCSQRSLLSSLRSDTQSLVFSSSRSNRPASPSVRPHLHFKRNTCHFFFSLFFGSPLLTSLHPSFHQCNPKVIITRCLKFALKAFWPVSGSDLSGWEKIMRGYVFFVRTSNH